MTAPHYYPTGIIAIAANVHSRTILRRAAGEGWRRQTRGNAFVFQPPRSLRGECARLAEIVHQVRPLNFPSATDGLLNGRLTPERRAEALRVSRRLDACLLLASVLDAGEGREAALVRVAEAASFHCSARSLRRWFARLEKHGVAGLAENKRGRVGAKRKAVAA